MFTTYKWDDLDRIVESLNNNKLVITSTDTVFGILSKNASAIYQIKKRDLTKPLIMFINNIKDAKGLTEQEQNIISKYWPGALTVIKNNVGYRVPNNKNILKIISKIGPLYSSSANLSNHPPIESIDDAKLVFKNYLDEVILIEDKSTKSLPSTIIDLDRNFVIRNGSINGEKIIKKILNK